MNKIGDYLSSSLPQLTAIFQLKKTSTYLYFSSNHFNLAYFDVIFFTYYFNLLSLFSENICYSFLKALIQSIYYK